MKEIERQFRRTDLDGRLEKLVDRMMQRIKKGTVIIPHEEGLRRVLLNVAHKAAMIGRDSQMGALVEDCHRPKR